MNCFVGIFPSANKCLDQNLATMAAWKKNEQIWLFGNRIVKTIDPDCFFKNSRFPLFILINKIISASLRLFFAIGRFLTRQNDDANCAKIQELLSAKSFCEEPLFHSDKPELVYQKLDKLAQTKNRIEKASIAFSCYFETLNFLNDESSINRILNEKIQILEEKVLDVDKEKVIKIIASLNKNSRNINLTNTQVSTAAFRYFMDRRYGKEAVDRAMQYYSLDKELVLSGTDIVALVIGTVTNLTKNDFKDKSENEILGLLMTYRNIRYDCIVPDKKAVYSKQLAHDQKVLTAILSFDEYRYDPNFSSKNLKVQPLRKYGYAEFLSRHLSYALQDDPKCQFPDGIIFPIYNEHGHLCLSQATAIISEKGLHGALIKPAFDPKNGEVVRCQIVFRGTSCFDSLLRDINPYETTYFSSDGPGKKSFESKSPMIFSQTMEQIKKFENLELEFMGHSLGGSDAQRAVAYFTTQLTQNKDKSVKKINLYAFNSPNIESNVCAKFIECVEKSKDTIMFNLRYFDVSGDIIQEFGVKRLGFCGKKVKKIPKNLNVSIFKFNRSFIEKVQNFVFNIISKIAAIFDEPIKAHTSYSLKLHEDYDLNQYNQMFIENIFTTKGDGHDNIKYSKEEYSILIDKNVLDDELMTNIGRLGKKINRFVYRISCGCFGRKHEHALTDAWKKRDKYELRLIPMNQDDGSDEEVFINSEK